MNFIYQLNIYELVILKFLIVTLLIPNFLSITAFNTASHDHIIKFVRFFSNDERNLFLRFCLQRLNDSWSFVERPYFHGQFSDFEVLKILDYRLSEVSERLRFYGIVSSITRDSIILGNSDGAGSRKPLFFNGRLKSRGHKISYYLQADSLWALGIRGQGVRVAVFDTGIDPGHVHFRRARIIEYTNWTNEPHSKDTIGHGTFVAGMLVSEPDDDDKCPGGISPDIDLYVFRLFTKKQTSYTSWFLDAFNYAMAKRIHIINLSIGGPDFQDKPFVEKVWELSAHGVLMVSAIGNDGPLYGTLNNPADQMDVIGVGGMDFGEEIARFSSRGMTTWEIPSGYGRVKPDIVTHGSQIVSSSLDGSCRTLSGTSVASPSVAAAVALLICAYHMMNGPQSSPSPASIKQAILSSAVRLSSPRANIFEQGMGKLNLIGAYRALIESKPQASAYPSYVDLTESPYMWPYSSQPLYSYAMPVIVNITIINSMAVSGVFSVPPVYHAIVSRNGEKVDVAISHSEILWPWTGYLALEITVPHQYSNWEGIVEGYIVAVIQSKTSADDQTLETSLKIPLKLKVIPTPPRRMRVLWDQFHNLRYPPGYIPRDNVRRQEPLDWTGDHIHTNFKDSFDHLRSRGFFVEVLGSHFGCFNASNYGTLVIMDPEEEFFIEERDKLYRDVTENGLSLIVIAEWYNVDLMRHLKFFDENTRQWWTPDTGGANVPAINDLLAPFGIMFSNQVLEGKLKIGPKIVSFNSGSRLSRFPSSNKHISRVLRSSALKDIGAELLQGVSSHVGDAAVLGLYAGPRNRTGIEHGRISVYGDSNCFDMTFRDTDCLWLWDSLLQFSRTGHVSEPLLSHVIPVSGSLVSGTEHVPMRSKDSKLFSFSSVVKSPANQPVRYRDWPECSRNSVSRTILDHSSVPDGSWYRPQPLLKREFSAPAMGSSHNYSPHLPINLNFRHAPGARVVLQRPTTLPLPARVYWLYLACMLSCSGVVICWFCRRLRPRVKEIRPILTSGPVLFFRN